MDLQVHLKTSSHMTMDHWITELTAESGNWFFWPALCWMWHCMVPEPYVWYWYSDRLFIPASHRLPPWDNPVVSAHDLWAWVLTQLSLQGSLRHFLTQHICSWEDTIQLALSLARGLAFLHAEQCKEGKQQWLRGYSVPPSFPDHGFELLSWDGADCGLAHASCFRPLAEICILLPAGHSVHCGKTQIALIEKWKVPFQLLHLTRQNWDTLWSISASGPTWTVTIFWSLTLFLSLLWEDPLLKCC